MARKGYYAADGDSNSNGVWVEETDERGPIDETPEIRLYIDHLGEFIGHCCASDRPTTVDQSVVSRVKEVCQ